ncbi:MAG: ZIP family zinc transporter [Rhodobacterales bacterium]|nr:MAG: ZIP family zinc transporter [Rhodobacterales bacterium]
MALALQAALWGGLAGAALLIGAAGGYFLQVPRRVSAGVMAFGVGVLVACLGFTLMPEALALGGVWPAVGGFMLGGGLFAGANAALARKGAKHRKRSRVPGGSGLDARALDHRGADHRALNHLAPGVGAGSRTGAELGNDAPADGAGNGPGNGAPGKRAGAAAAASLAIALGALLDGMPEAAAIGTSLLDGHGVALVTVLAVFISNLPEGLSSTVGMKTAGLSGRFIFTLWGGITVACIFSAWLGYAVIGGLGPVWVAVAVASAAGAIFVMIIDTMIPEAFEDIHALSGPIAASGFLLTFIAANLLEV